MTRQHAIPVLRACAALVALATAAVAVAKPSAADSTDDYPIPRRMLATTCDAEQILAATRVSSPEYYKRYMIDYNNHSPEIQQATQDKMHRFYLLSPADRRAYSEEMVTHYPPEALTSQWPNHAKIFFNNKGVVAKSTESCGQYPPGDMSVWDG